MSLVTGILPPAQYLTQKIPRIRNIQKTTIFYYILANISLNKISFPYNHIKKKKRKLRKIEKMSRLPSETMIAQSRIFVKTFVAKMNISMINIFVQRNL